MNRLTFNQFERLAHEANIPPQLSRADYMAEISSFLSHTNYPKKQTKTYDNIYQWIVEHKIDIQPQFSEHETAVLLDLMNVNIKTYVNEMKTPEKL
jgi:hypothetical protein